MAVAAPKVGIPEPKVGVAGFFGSSVAVLAAPSSASLPLALSASVSLSVSLSLAASVLATAAAAGAKPELNEVVRPENLTGVAEPKEMAPLAKGAGLVATASAALSAALLCCSFSSFSLRSFSSRSLRSFSSRSLRSFSSRSLRSASCFLAASAVESALLRVEATGAATGDLSRAAKEAEEEEEAAAAAAENKVGELDGNVGSCKLATAGAGFENRLCEAAIEAPNEGTAVAGVALVGGCFTGSLVVATGLSSSDES